MFFVKNVINFSSEKFLLICFCFWKIAHSLIYLLHLVSVHAHVSTLTDTFQPSDLLSISWYQFHVQSNKKMTNRTIIHRTYSYYRHHTLHNLHVSSQFRVFEWSDCFAAYIKRYKHQSVAKWNQEKKILFEFSTSNVELSNWMQSKCKRWRLCPWTASMS